MSEKTSIMNGVRWIYGESLKEKKVRLTIARVESGQEFTDMTGRKSNGFAVCFKETQKALGVVGSTVRRQLVMACEGDDYSRWPGKAITLYAVPSKKSATGWAVRVGPAEQSAATADDLAAEARRKEADEAKGGAE